MMNSGNGVRAEGSGVREFMYLRFESPDMFGIMHTQIHCPEYGAHAAKQQKGHFVKQTLRMPIVLILWRLILEVFFFKHFQYCGIYIKVFFFLPFFTQSLEMLMYTYEIPCFDSVLANDVLNISKLNQFYYL